MSSATCRCILVDNIPRGLGSEVIRQYFFARGGEIKAFRCYENGRKAILEFEDSGGTLHCYS